MMLGSIVRSKLLLKLYKRGGRGEGSDNANVIFGAAGQGLFENGHTTRLLPNRAKIQCAHRVRLT